MMFADVPTRQTAVDLVKCEKQMIQEFRDEFIKDAPPATDFDAAMKVIEKLSMRVYCLEVCLND